MGTAHKLEKITFNIPSSLKEQIMVLKSEIGVSLSTIYNNAITEYIKKQELEKWHRGVDMALEDTDYRKLSRELDSDTGDIYEY
jgi:hypothetical protein